MKSAKLKQDLTEVPKPVLAALIRGEVVPFVGAGFSRNCDGPNGFVMPDWKTLGKSVAGELSNYEYDGKGNIDFMTLEKLGIGSDKDRSMFYKFKHLRNEVVHGVASARKKDAEFALKSAEKLLAK